MGDVGDDYKAYNEIKKKIKALSPRCECLGPKHVGVVMTMWDDEGLWKCKRCAGIQLITDHDRMEFKKLQRGDEQ